MSGAAKDAALQSPTVQLLTRIRDQLREFQNTLSVDEWELGQRLAESIDLLNDAIVEEVRAAE